MINGKHLTEVIDLKDMDHLELYNELTKNEKADGKREYCYEVELEMLRRIKDAKESDRTLRTLNIIEGRTGYEKKLIAEIKKHEYSESWDFRLLLDYLEETFETEKEKLAEKRKAKSYVELSGDTPQARALIEAKVQDVIAAATWTELDLMPHKELDVADGSRIGQIMQDLWYNNWN